jgi:hypothetical protein
MFQCGRRLLHHPQPSTPPPRPPERHPSRQRSPGNRTRSRRPTVTEVMMLLGLRQVPRALPPPALGSLERATTARRKTGSRYRSNHLGAGRWQGISPLVTDSLIVRSSGSWNLYCSPTFLIILRLYSVDRTQCISDIPSNAGFPDMQPIYPK